MGALMHVYVWEHLFSPYYRTTWWMFTKLGRDEVFMAVHMYEGVSAKSAMGQIQGRAKVCHRGGGGVPLKKHSSSDCKATMI